MNIKVTIMYDGSQYCGWQKQDHVHSLQSEVERIVSILNKEKTVVVASGRTDKGVHALGQVFHFELIYNIPVERLFIAFNDLCPDDIRAIDMEHVDDCFHARFSAKYKHYRYYINTGSYNMFERDYIYQLNRAVNIDAMMRVKPLFLGKKDYSAFNATTFEEKRNQVRDIKLLEITVDNDIIVIDIIADSFLRYMVRMIVGTLVEVGLGRKTIDQVADILDSKCKTDFVYNFPPEGLYLMKVFYEGEFDEDKLSYTYKPL